MTPPLGIRANPIWGSGKVDAAQTLADVHRLPVWAAGGGGGGGGGDLRSTIRMGLHAAQLSSRGWASGGRDSGRRPGLMLFASLVSEHVDEILRLVNNNPRVGAVWRRNGGPLLVRRLLYGPPRRNRRCCREPSRGSTSRCCSSVLVILDSLRRTAPQSRHRAASGHSPALWPGGDFKRLDAAALASARPHEHARPARDPRPHHRRGACAACGAPAG